MKDTFYFKHETNARSDSKLVNVQMNHGMEGIGVYWCIVEMLYENDGFIRPEYERITFELRTSTDVVRSVINDYGLFIVENDKIYSESALRQLSERKDKSVKATESVNKRWKKFERNTNVIRNEKNVILNRIEENSIEDNNKKEIENSETSENPVFGKSKVIYEAKELFNEMINSFAWKNQILTSVEAKKKNLTEDALNIEIRAYIEEQRITGELARSLNEYRKHFWFWLKKKLAIIPPYPKPQKPIKITSLPENHGEV